ncbi:putative oxidoreductase [Actinacidiphila reveromycinica]|uniref:Putative oxidoreductase n=1 Tax=Actinacidiphila reveromycinica TaxID=659352 RepID=A0A7U3V009_9ACTN|nr:aldo/keto reductase [Streptomyces sp. SN-593]BBB01979.1 putative oxidoreductase [Streptomyces sp. SN-593]
MRHRTLGAGGPVVSEVGLGTWRPLSRDGRRGAARLVGAALDLGITLFDTAGSYGDAEEALGIALRGVPREAYVLSTKVYYEPGGAVAGLSRAAVRAGVERSLRALRTEQVDLLSAHRFDDGTPLAETVAAFGELLQEGKIAHYGFSEWTAHQITAACAVATEMGVRPPVASQPQYNILWRVPEQAVLPLCQDLGIGTVAFWPLAQGLLTGKYAPGEPPPADSRAADPTGSRLMDHLMAEPLLERVQLFARLARREGMTPARLAVSWVLNRSGVTSALVGASTPQQLAETASAAGVLLPEPTMELIDRIFAGCVYDDVAGTG